LGSPSFILGRYSGEMVSSLMYSDVADNANIFTECFCVKNKKSCELHQDKSSHERTTHYIEIHADAPEKGQSRRKLVNIQTT
jgi:hypothetical protein